MNRTVLPKETALFLTWTQHTTSAQFIIKYQLSSSRCVFGRAHRFLALFSPIPSQYGHCLAVSDHFVAEICFWQGEILFDNTLMIFILVPFLKVYPNTMLIKDCFSFVPHVQNFIHLLRLFTLQHDTFKKRNELAWYHVITYMSVLRNLYW